MSVHFLKYKDNYNIIDSTIRNLPVGQWNLRVGHVCRYIINNFVEIQNSEILKNKVICFLEIPSFKDENFMEFLSVRNRVNFRVIKHCFQRPVKEISENQVETSNEESQSLLHAAAQEGNLSLVKYLVETQKIDVDVRDKSGRTPLYYACGMGRVDVVRYLIETAQADSLIVASDLSMPLHFACGKGRLAVVHYLVGTEKAEKMINSPVIFGYTPLMLACEQGHLNIAQCLLETKKVDLKATTINKLTPLHIASFNGRFPIVEYFLKEGIFTVDEPSMEGTALHKACQYGFLDIVEYLVKAGANINALSSQGLTPLRNACTGRHYHVVDYLLKTGKTDPKITLNGLVLFNEAVTFRKKEVLICFKNYYALLSESVWNGRMQPLDIDKYLKIVTEFETFYSAIQNQIWFFQDIQNLVLPFLYEDSSYKNAIEQSFSKIEQLSDLTEQLEASKTLMVQLTSLRILLNQFFRTNNTMEEMFSKQRTFLNESITKFELLIDTCKSKMQKNDFETELQHYLKSISFTLFSNFNIGVEIKGSNGEKSISPSETYKLFLNKSQEAIGQYGIDCGADLVAIGIDPEIRYHINACEDKLGKEGYEESMVSLKMAVEKKLTQLEEIKDKVSHEYSLLENLHEELEHLKGQIDKTFFTRLKTVDTQLKITLLRVFLEQDPSVVSAHLGTTSTGEISQLKEDKNLTLSELFNLVGGGSSKTKKVHKKQKIQ